MASKLKKAIGAVKDQTSIGLAMFSISNTSSNLEVTVLKATTHDDVPIEDKYIREILQIVSSNKVHAASCARAIGKRIGHTHNWIVATKSLILIFRIFQDGDPYFPREILHAMKRGAKILNLSSFRDDSWDFTAFVRTFAIYLDERLECFLTGKLQRRYMHGQAIGSNNHARDVKPAMLIDKISYWQRLLERAIATRPTGQAKMSLLVQIALYAIVQESFELYKDISDGLTLVLDNFFHLHYQNCVSAFQTCVKAAKQFKELSDFYSSCKSIGVGRASEYPSVRTISDELIETLRGFLKDQSSFQSRSTKPTNRFSLLSAPPTCNVESTSLQDLIIATETGPAGPAISIDLEAYSPHQGDNDFGIHHRSCRSTRSLPVSISMTDAISLLDWSQQDDEMNPQKHHQQQEQDQKHDQPMDSSSASDNWELVLAATISSSSSASPQLLSDNNTNTLNTYEKNTMMAKENHSFTAKDSFNQWDLILFEAPQPCNPQQPLPQVDYYNPFLQDPIELTSTSHAQHVPSIPTFQAIIPMFSMLNSYQTSFKAVQIENDPFNAPFYGDAFSSGPLFNSPMSRQKLLHEQQLWLQNQNNIIAKVNMA